MRISGIASGMDTETMVRDLMKAQRMKADKFGQNKQLMLWRQEQYNNVNKDFANLILDIRKELELTKTTSSGTMYSNSMSNLTWVKKASSSNEEIFTASTTTAAPVGIHRLKVEQLAEGVNMASQDAVMVNGKPAATETRLSALNITDGKVTFEVKVNINGNNQARQVSVDVKANETIAEFMKRINNTTFTEAGQTIPLGIQASFDSTKGRLFLSTKGTGELAQIKVVEDEKGLFTGVDNKFKLGYTSALGEAAVNGTDTLKTLGVKDPIDGNEIIQGSVAFKVNGTITRIQYNNNETVQDVIDKINGQGMGINASLTPEGKLQLQSKHEFTIVEDSEKLFTGENNLFQMGSYGLEKSGQNAKISFNGAAGLEYSWNQFTINGIEVNLKALPENTNKEFTIKVDTDVDGVYNKIKSFVDKYNELIEKMNGKVGEKRYRSYLPLTSDQKETLKEDEIKKWEEKAQSGLLANDGMINRTLQSMRNGLYDKFIGNDSSAKYNHLTSVGITTGDYKSKGRLEIDEAKLKNAIMDDVDGVLNLFFTQYTPGPNDGDLSKQELAKKTREGTGLLNRLFDDVVVGMKEIINKSGAGSNADIYRNVRSNILIDFVTGTSTGKGSISFLDDDIFKMEKTIADEERRMSRIEKSYWKKFTAMEKALQSMNSQSSWLAQQLGSGR